MKTALDLLNAIQIPKPCTANWADMIGDDYARFCNVCAKNVYNLSALNAADAAALLRDKEGHLCIRLYRRLDGTVMTADCQKGTTGGLVKHLASAVAVASTMFMAGCGMAPEPEQGQNDHHQQKSVEHEQQVCVMGEPVTGPMMGSPALPVNLGGNEVLTIPPREVPATK